MARQRIADGLQLYAELDTDQGYYFFGVTLDGAAIDLYARPQGGVDDDLREAREAAAEQQAAADQQAAAQQPAPAAAPAPAAEQPQPPAATGATEQSPTPAAGPEPAAPPPAE